MVQVGCTLQQLVRSVELNCKHACWTKNFGVSFHENQSKWTTYTPYLIIKLKTGSLLDKKQTANALC